MKELENLNELQKAELRREAESILDAVLLYAAKGTCELLDVKYNSEYVRFYFKFDGTPILTVDYDKCERNNKYLFEKNCQPIFKEVFDKKIDEGME